MKHWVSSYRFFAIAATGFLLLQCADLRAQVTLEGKQFKFDGEEVFPLAVNFTAYFACEGCMPDNSTPPAPSSFMLVPDNNKAWNHDSFDCATTAECDALILQMFFKIKEMGYNTIRIVKLSPYYRHVPPLDVNVAAGRKYSLNMGANIPGTAPDGAWIDLEGPPFDGPLSQAAFDMIEHALDLAEIAGLKVILLCIEGLGAEPLLERERMYPTRDMLAVETYTSYLSALSARLAGHPALMAYDLGNEPNWAGWDWHPVNDWWQQWSKASICDFTSLWYNTIKSNAPDHLVTLGGVGLGDVHVFDMNVMHLDFYSLHIYPFAEYDGSYDLQRIMNLYQIHLHWMSQQCEIPWIIGETGFAATDKPGPLPFVGDAPEHHEWPYMHGNESQQKEFALNSLLLTRQAGGSGWSWWSFQEKSWYSLPDVLNDPNVPPQILHENYFGIMYRGTGEPDHWEGKLMADMLIDLPIPPMPGEPGVMPDNYYHPYTFGEVACWGYVLHDGQGVKDAPVWVEWRNTPLSLGDPLFTSQIAFANENGFFYVDQQSPILGHAPPELEKLQSTAAGYSRAGITNCSVIEAIHFHFEKSSLEAEKTISDLVVPSLNGMPLRRFSARNKLFIDNVDVIGWPNPHATQVLFEAAYKVHARPGFHARAGSQARLHTTPTLPNCLDPSYHIMNIAEDDKLSMLGDRAGESSNSVALRFEADSQNEPEFMVYPNPTHDLLEVRMSDSSESDELWICDLHGRPIHVIRRLEPVLQIDLAALAKGVYSLIWIQPNGRQVVKIVRL
jgi:hypothetical protein